MAITTIRSTYALDVASVRALERLARRWRVSKSEALRRAILGATHLPADRHTDALAALDELQSGLALDRDRAKAWADEARRERRASAAKAESRRR